jgi:hypothetical protein
MSPNGDVPQYYQPSVTQVKYSTGTTRRVCGHKTQAAVAMTLMPDKPQVEASPGQLSPIRSSGEASDSAGDSSCAPRLTPRRFSPPFSGMSGGRSLPEGQKPSLAFHPSVRRCAVSHRTRGRTSDLATAVVA